VPASRKRERLCHAVFCLPIRHLYLPFGNHTALDAGATIAGGETMTRSYTLLAALSAAMTFPFPCLLAQGQPASSTRGVGQAGQPSTIVLPSTNVYVTGGGFYGNGIYVVPSGALTAPFTGAGISLADRSGISLYTPIETGLQSTLGPREGGLPNNGMAYATAPYGVALGYTSAPCPPGETPGRLINDLGPSYFVGATGPATPPISLGEVAAQNKAKGPRSVRIYTNADAERLSNQIRLTK
jgi:hypothetical protein